MGARYTLFGCAKERIGETLEIGSFSTTDGESSFLLLPYLLLFLGVFFPWAGQTAERLLKEKPVGAEFTDYFFKCHFS